MKIALYCIIIALVIMAPVTKQDIGDLEPIQAVWLYTQDGDVVLQTDTGDYGAGTTVETAVKDMKENSEGIVYLDTAQFLLVSEQATDRLEDIVAYLKNTVKICLWNGNQVSSAARYMQAHNVGCKVKEYRKGKPLHEIPEFIEDNR